MWYWRERDDLSFVPDRKRQTLTPNPDAIYLMPFFDTTGGSTRQLLPSGGC